MLAEFLARHRRVLVLTGAGCSTASGIPDYRDAAGAWKHHRPVAFHDFASSAATRRRYWARSMAGWPRVAAARPNAAHLALARLEELGRVHAVVTQNVDGLHQHAGSRRVVDLHGRLDRVECLDCAAAFSRADIQELLTAWNPGQARALAGPAPDGDAALERAVEDFRAPDCPECGGRLKPGVVFFGENVPKPRVDAALAALAASQALLVVGSSLMVYSGFRFCLAAQRLGQPIAAVNLGRTRADQLLSLKVEADCGQALEAALRATCSERAASRDPVSEGTSALPQPN